MEEEAWEGLFSLIDFMLFGLQVVFIVLKLAGEINWPWLWVLCPIWIPASITLVGSLLIGIIWLVLKITDD